VRLWKSCNASLTPSVHQREGARLTAWPERLREIMHSPPHSPTPQPGMLFGATHIPTPTNDFYSSMLKYL
jgi:hypothetical protein